MEADCKGRSSWALAKIEKHLLTLAAVIDGFILLQVILLAQIRCPSGW